MQTKLPEKTKSSYSTVQYDQGRKVTVGHSKYQAASSSKEILELSLTQTQTTMLHGRR